MLRSLVSRTAVGCGSANTNQYTHMRNGNRHMQYRRERSEHTQHVPQACITTMQTVADKGIVHMAWEVFYKD